MKRAKLTISITAFLALVMLGVALMNPSTRASSETDQFGVSVELKPRKQRYIQGEIVRLDIRIKNNDRSDVFLRGADVKSGFLRLFVSKEGQLFQQYSHSAWIRGPQPGFVMKPGRVIESTVDLLWNFKPKVSHLNQNAAMRVSKDKILTDYAFDEPGIYQIKAVLTIPGEQPKTNESEPIQIIVDAPVGRDIVVWNRIKARGEIAYFIQQADLRNERISEQEQVVIEVESIANSYPDTILGNQIKDSLNRFREKSAKRKDFIERLKKANPPNLP